MSEAFDLTGAWEGLYTQHDQQRPLSAQWVQQGNVLTGTMTDGCTEFAASISEIAMREGLPPGADEQIVEQIRADHPDAPLGRVMAETRLPAHSKIEGELEGRNLRFVKTYQGEHLAGFSFGGIRKLQKVEGHEVYYQGKVSPAGNEIEGRWQILGADAQPIRAEGWFYLKRVR
jgi:hypothetical protein